MRVLLLPSRAGPAALLLVLCLQLGASNVQENNWKVMTMDLQMQQTAKKNEEVPVTLKLSTEVQECMVVKTYLKSSRPLEGTSHNYDFMSCLCNDYPGTFFWDIRSNYTVKIAASRHYSAIKYLP